MFHPKQGVGLILPPQPDSSLILWLGQLEMNPMIPSTIIKIIPLFSVHIWLSLVPAESLIFRLFKVLSSHPRNRKCLWCLYIVFASCVKCVVKSLLRCVTDLFRKKFYFLYFVQIYLGKIRMITGLLISLLLLFSGMRYSSRHFGTFRCVALHNFVRDR